MASVEYRKPNVSRAQIESYDLVVYEPFKGEVVIEVRPRKDIRSPFLVAIPAAEKKMIEPSLMCGPAKTIPTAGVLDTIRSALSQDSKWWLMSNADMATPTKSYYLFCRRLPSVIVFGANRAKPQYKHVFVES
jgi:hypothetical protein